MLLQKRKLTQVRSQKYDEDWSVAQYSSNCSIKHHSHFEVLYIEWINGSYYIGPPCSSKDFLYKDFPVAQTVKNLPAMQETRVRFLGWEVPLEKGMAIHSSILTWRIPWTEKPGGLQSVGSQRVRHDWATNIHTHIGLPRWLSGKESACQCRRYRRCGFDPWVGKSPWRRKWQPIPVFLPGKIPWTEEPGRLQSMGLQRVGHDWANECTRMHAPCSTENCIQYPMRNRTGKEHFVSFFSDPFHQHPTCCPFWRCLDALPLHP